MVRTKTVESKLALLCEEGPYFVVADNSGKHKTTGGQKGTEKTKIGRCNRKNIKRESFITGIKEIVRDSESEIGRGWITQLIKEIVQCLIKLS